MLLEWQTKLVNEPDLAPKFKIVPASETAIWLKESFYNILYNELTIEDVCFVLGLGYVPLDEKWKIMTVLFNALKPVEEQAKANLN